jgi:hypothetical protein
MTKNNHVKNLEPHKKSNILSVTLHPGRAPNSPLEPVPVAEISHLAGELFGTPENPIHPAPKNLPAPTDPTPKAATTTEEDAMEIEDKKPAAKILKNPPQPVTQDNQSSSLPLPVTAAENLTPLTNAHDMDTNEVVNQVPALDNTDPLLQLNEHIERTKEYLQ